MLLAGDRSATGPPDEATQLPCLRHLADNRAPSVMITLPNITAPPEPPKGITTMLNRWYEADTRPSGSASVRSEVTAREGWL
jgi:hypothetical protein